MAHQHYLLLALAALLQHRLVAVQAHSWVEQLNVIAPNGTLIEPPGYPRGNVLRTSPSFRDPDMSFLIPPGGGATEISASQLMCKDSQTSQRQTDGSPRLQATPGSAVALRYQENGHVTIPTTQEGKPANRGTNFVYYTSESRPDDKFLAIHRIWNVEGNGGDGRGRLISTRNFDDGQCYQINDHPISQDRQKEFPHSGDSLQGANLWCQQDIQIPADAKPGSTITLYWVWDWPTMPGATGFPNGKQEIYTTCMDIDIIAKTSVSNKVISGGYVKQDLVSAAVSAQFADIANPTAVVSPNAIPFQNAVVASSSQSDLPSTTLLPTASPTRTLCPHSGIATASKEGTVTMTVTVTVTANSTAAATSRGVVTVTENDMITLTVTNTVLQRRQDAQAIPTVANQMQSTSTQTTCSKTAPAYRLRARLPFYIPPESQPNTHC